MKNNIVESEWEKMYNFFFLKVVEYTMIRD